MNTKMILSENSNYLMKCRSVFGVKIQSKKVEQLENEKISQSGFVYLKKSQMKILKILINPDFYQKKIYLCSIKYTNNFGAKNSKLKEVNMKKSLESGFFCPKWGKTVFGAKIRILLM